MGDPSLGMGNGFRVSLPGDIYKGTERGYFNFNAFRSSFKEVIVSS